MSKTDKIAIALKLLLELPPEQVDTLVTLIKNVHATEFPGFPNDAK